MIEKKLKRDKISAKDIQKMLDNIDWENHDRRVVWSLNEPRCSCDSCYNWWLESGREFYKDDVKLYEKLRKESLERKEQKQISQRLREKENSNVRIYRAA